VETVGVRDDTEKSKAEKPAGVQYRVANFVAYTSAITKVNSQTQSNIWWLTEICLKRNVPCAMHVCSINSFIANLLLAEEILHDIVHNINLLFLGTGFVNHLSVIDRYIL